jgi:hypothetical protein
VSRGILAAAQNWIVGTIRGPNTGSAPSALGGAETVQPVNLTHLARVLRPGTQIGL